MKLTVRSRRIFVLLLSLLGTAALFLPFTSGVSPFLVVSEYASAFLEGEIPREWKILLLATPFFLYIPILIWQVRQLIVDRLTKGEIALAYLLPTAAMLAITVLLSMVTFRLVQEPPGSVFQSVIDIALFISLWLLLIANVLLLMRNHRVRLSREATAEAFSSRWISSQCNFLPHRIRLGWETASRRIHDCGRFHRLRRGHRPAVASRAKHCR